MNTEKIPNLDRISELWAKIKNALTGKQNALTPDDSITLNNNNISVTTPVKGITKAEYDALNEGEKGSGLYVITDANINLNDRGDVYSTEETRIGTWIDGKPLYRKVVIMSFSASSPSIETSIDGMPAAMVDVLANVYGYCILDSGEKSNIGTYLIFIYPTVGTNNWVIYQNISGDLHTYNLQIIFEYTKTTD